MMPRIGLPQPMQTITLGLSKSKPAMIPKTFFAAIIISSHRDEKGREPLKSLFNRSTLCDRAELLITLYEAARNAVKYGHTVLASFTMPISTSDPLPVFSAFRQLAVGECFFWEKPEEEKSFVGIGTTLSIETGGAQRFQDVEAACHILRQNALIH